MKIHNSIDAEQLIELLKKWTKNNKIIVSIYKRDLIFNVIKDKKIIEEILLPMAKTKM